MTGRFDLVTIDLDGTLLPDDTAFGVVLRANGRAADVKGSDARFFAGEISLEDCFWEQWEWVRELTPAQLHRALRDAPWLAGIREGVAVLRAAGLQVCLLTDQPSSITDFLARWDLQEAIASPVTVKEGKQVAIDPRFDKWANLQARLAQTGIRADRVCHIGNGSNDVPVWGQVGAGVAVFAEADVAAAATLDLGRPADLMEVAAAVVRMAAATHY